MSEGRLTRRARQQLTRLKLIEAAEGLFAHTGFDAASIEQIAAKAGFTRGAFYSNFATKDELFLALLDKRRLETQTALDAIFRETKDAEERFRAARDWYAHQWQQRNWTILKTEFSLRALRKGKLRKKVSALWQQELETYSALISQYLAEAGLASIESPQTIAMSLLATSQGLGMLSLLNSNPELDGRIAESRTRAFDQLIPRPSAAGRRTGAVRR